MTEVALVNPKLPEFSKIEVGSIVSDLVAMLDDHRREIHIITEQMGSTWDVVAQPIDNLSDQLNKYWSPISHLNSVLNSDALREAYNTAIPELSRFGTDLGQNKSLFEAYARLQASPEFNELAEAQRKSVTNTLRNFRLAGVNLSGSEKIRYKEIAQRLAELSSKFSDNVLDATNAWTKQVDDRAKLNGLPETALEIAREAAKSRNTQGYILTLDFPCYHAVMTFAEDRDLRKEMYEAYSTRASDQGPTAGRYDNSQIMQEILSLRLEKAKLLGFSNYADYSLATKMAESTNQVLTFLTDLAEKSIEPARREMRELRDFAKSLGATDFSAWDISYYGEKLKQERFAISQEELRPYFPVNNVIAGLFSVVEKLFDVRLNEIEDFDRYHEDVKLYSVQQNGRGIAFLYMDLFARQNKRGGAWMADYAVRCRQSDGTIQKPVAFITCNFAPATDNTPALLTHSEVTTLFHEFGHALHHMLTQIESYDVSGINGVAWDAVELPSQFLENWCWDAESIGLISGHYETAAPLPREMLEKMLAARNFQSAMAMVRQLEFAIFDFRLHCEFAGQQDFSIQSLLDDVRQNVAVFKPPAFNRFQHSFSHIFAGGYGAGYYSYKWAEILASDAFSKFEENGIFDQQTGREFLQAILEKGGSREPMELFTEFRGRLPKVDALLRHNGIAS